jgi:nitroreductase
MIKDIILKNRSYRRFFQNLARLSASAANLQPLKYMLSSTPEKNALIFSHLRWAGYLKNWPGPEESERPSAYIIILGDTKISKDFGCDHGIAAQNILLGAAEKGLGGCIIGSIDRKNLRKAFEIPTRYEILLVIAIGKPKEKVVIDIAKDNKNIKYWRDKNKSHHVPKRRLEDIIIK